LAVIEAFDVREESAPKIVQTARDPPVEELGLE